MNMEFVLAEISGALAVGLTVGALALVYVAFKVTKFAVKIFLLFIALLILAGFGWYFLSGQAR